jgi:hypothetical protein
VGLVQSSFPRQELCARIWVTGHPYFYGEGAYATV